MREYLKYAENESKELGYTTMFMEPTGVENFSQGNSTLFNMLPPGGGDIPGGSALNDGNMGNPPPSNYPQ